eukprot:sb/3467379/
MHRRLFRIIDFAIQGMAIQHFGVRKTGSRVLRESIRRASKDPDALMEIKTQLTSLDRNRNPMLSIYASVLREEALRKQKQRPTTVPPPQQPAAPVTSAESSSDQDSFPIPRSAKSVSTPGDSMDSYFDSHKSYRQQQGGARKLSKPPSIEISDAEDDYFTRRPKLVKAPRSLVIEPEVFKFGGSLDNELPSCSSTTSSNVPTPETAKLVGSPFGLSAAKMRKGSGGMAGEMSSPPVTSGSLPMETVPEQPVARRRVSMGGGSHTGVVGSRGKRPLGHSRPLSLPDFDGLFPGSGPSSPR